MLDTVIYLYSPLLPQGECRISVGAIGAISHHLELHTKSISFTTEFQGLHTDEYPLEQFLVFKTRSVQYRQSHDRYEKTKAPVALAEHVISLPRLRQAIH